MKKFKLSKNDSKSLENVAAIIENNVLRNAAVDVSRTDLSGGKEPEGWSKLVFGQIGGGWPQVID